MHKYFLAIFVVLVSACVAPVEEVENDSILETSVVVSNDSQEISPGEVVKDEEVTFEFIGPAGCSTKDECDAVCMGDNEECGLWCQANPETCEELKVRGIIEVPGEGEGPREDGPREGDGLWKKAELTFFVKDVDGALTAAKRDIIVGTITSDKKTGSGFHGWNAALAELNRLYPDNVVPDKLVEVSSESDADIVISTYVEKEFCCDYGGDPIQGMERSTIDENNVKLLSKVGIYNIVDIDSGFLAAMSRHELGHTLGIFGHTDNKDDLMSIVSPSDYIKKINLDHLYDKYKYEKIETSEEAAEADIANRDRKVRPE